VIALWLGHESRETTSMYVHADLSLKERCIRVALSQADLPVVVCWLCGSSSLATSSLPFKTGAVGVRVPPG
jgi:hypothetical protein